MNTGIEQKKISCKKKIINKIKYLIKLVFAQLLTCDAELAFLDPGWMSLSQ